MFVGYMFKTKKATPQVLGVLIPEASFGGVYFLLKVLKSGEIKNTLHKSDDDHFQEIRSIQATILVELYQETQVNRRKYSSTKKKKKKQAIRRQTNEVAFTY